MLLVIVCSFVYNSCDTGSAFLKCRLQNTACPANFLGPRDHGVTRHCRVLQFGIKFYAATAGFMVLILWISADLPVLRQWRLLYAYFTIVVVLSEKVRGTRMVYCLWMTCPS